jgi:hypothetical protein
LSAGTFEIEPNFQYSHQTNDVTGFRRDAFGPALAGRVGLPWRSQFEMQIPYVVEDRRAGGGSSRSNGIGDLSFGLSHQLLSERGWVPDLIGSLSYTAATGANTLFSNFTSPVGHGAGFDTLAGDLTLVKRVDPLVFFGGYSFAHSFAGRQGANSVDLGNSNAVRLGSILATGPDTSLRAVFNLTFFERTVFNGIALSGSDEPSALMELGGSVVVSPSTLLDVGIGAGMTRSAPDFRLTVSLPVRF